jgi:hypothetical protein
MAGRARLGPDHGINLGLNFPRREFLRRRLPVVSHLNRLGAAFLHYRA